jgi:hypothetical protein
MGFYFFVLSRSFGRYAFISQNLLWCGKFYGRELPGSQLSVLGFENSIEN